MYRKGEGNRDLIVAAATKLFQQRGFGAASFNDIAERSGIPKGNFFYYFRSKDDVLEAVIEERLKDLSKSLDDWDRRFSDPVKRIGQFLCSFTDDWEHEAVYGCPHGSLCLEFAKTRRDLLPIAVKTLKRLRLWLNQQLKLAGVGGSADRLALEILARCQGIVLMGAVLHDKAFVVRELAATKTWIKSLCPKAPVAKKRNARTQIGSSKVRERSAAR